MSSETASQSIPPVTRRFARPRLTERLAVFGTAALVCSMLLVGIAPTTSSATPPLAPVPMGTASTYSLLSGASITNTGLTTIVRGDVGVTVVDTISGFAPGAIVGSTHNADSAALQAFADLVTAYNNAEARPFDAAFAGDQIGVTLTPGVYHSGAAVSNTGIMTLDGQNNPNSVFIFQVVGALSQAANAEIKLINGAQASRVFWQSTGAVTLGAGAKFAGTILGFAAVSVGDGAVVNGRALARNGAVTTYNNNFYTTPPAVTITGGASATSSTDTPTISGTTDAAVGRPVSVTVNGQTLTTTVLSGGAWSVTATTIPNGTYAVVATVNDTQGNDGSATQSLTISVDTTPPVVTINGGAIGYATTSTPTIAGTTDEATGTTVTVTIDGQTLTTTVLSGGTWSVTAASVINDVYTVNAFITDAHSNTGTAMQSLTVDTVLPVVTITGGAFQSTNDSTPTIAGTTDVGTGATVTVTVASQTWTALVQSNGTWVVTATTITDGIYTATASVTDPAGNPGTSSQTLTIDTVAPSITITGGATALTGDNTPTLAGTVTSDVALGATVTVTIAGQTFTPTVQSGRTWSVTAATIVDGPHTATASVSDPAGNPGNASQVLTIDTTAPTVAITGGATRLTKNATPTISGTTNAATGTTVTVTIAGQTLFAFVQSGGTWNVTTTTVADGTNTVLASITDPAGNTGTASQALTVDTTAPTVTITGGATATTNDPTPTIVGTTDAAAATTVTVTIAGQTLTTTAQSDGTWAVTAATVAEGPNSVVASVIDPATNTGTATQTLTIDTTAPSVAITGGATKATNDVTPTIAGTTDAATGTAVTVTISSQTLSTTVLSGGTWTVTATTLTDGTYVATVSITDPIGNPGSATQSLIIDTVLPVIAITGGAAVSTNDPTPTITGTTDADVGTTVTVLVAAQSLTTLVQTGGTWTVTATTLTDATRTVTANVTDPAGNNGSATQSLTVDTVAPTVTITGGATALTNDATPTISGTTSSDVLVGSTVTVMVSGQTLTPTVLTGGTWTVTTATLLDGPRAVSAAATDASGNTGSANQTLTIDTTAPSVTINGGATRLTNDSTPTITGTTNAASGTTVTVTVAGQTATGLVQISGTWNVTLEDQLSDGPHIATASIIDPAGNTGSASQTITVDTVFPIVTITGGPTVLTMDATPTIEGTTDVAVGSTVTVTIAGQTLTTTVQTGGTWTVTAATVADGTRIVTASATDPALNTGSGTQALTIDTTAPTVTISGGATKSTNDSTPPISGTAPDVPAGTQVTVTIAGQTLSTQVQGAGTWTVTATTVVDGIQSVVVAVTDTAGNTGSATQSLTIDTVVPLVTIAGGATRSTNDSTPLITGTTDAAVGATITVTVAGQSLTTLVQSGGIWNVTAATIADGTRDIVASLTDAAGNTGSATQSLTTDSSAPTVTITGGATKLTNDATPTIVGTTDAANAAPVTVTVAGQTLTTTVQAGAWSVTAAHVSDGANSVVVSIQDLAGNVGSATQSLIIDTTPPTMTITGPSSLLTNDGTPTIDGTTDLVAGSTVTVTIAGQTLLTLVQIGGTWNVTPAAVADGTRTVVASVVDAAGNSASATQSITIDTTAPAVTITGGLSSGTNDSTPTITGTASGVPTATMVVLTVSSQSLSTTLQAGGGWSLTAANLADGMQTVLVSVTDLAGNTGHATQSLLLNTAPPAVPVLDFTSVGPKRVFDTRPGQSPNALRTVPKQKVSGVNELQVLFTNLPGFVPVNGVGAVSLNVTATNAEGDGFITVYPCADRESVSSVNYRAGQTVANAVIAPVSAAGTVCFFSSAPTDIVVDINGWFPAGKAFTSAGPSRIFDTRPGQSPQALRTVTKEKIQGGSSLEVQVTDLAALVPATGVVSVSLTVTATDPSAAGFITVYACGTRELVSSVNYTAGQTVANAVIASVSATGTVCFFSSATTDLVVDINGWMKTGAEFTGVSPQRVLDTRPGESPNALRNVLKQKIGGAYVLEVQITDLPGAVPASGVGAVSLNVTVTSPNGDGFLTVYSCGAREEVSSLNYVAGQTVSNAVLTPLSPTGTICIFSQTPADVIIDVNGWFSTTLSA